MYFRFEIGSDSPTTGIVVLLAVAKLLSEIEISFKAGISNVMFAFLNGESFDYIGSSNMVYSMVNGTFPPVHDISTEIDDSENKNDTNEKENVKYFLHQSCKYTSLYVHQKVYDFLMASKFPET